MKIFRFKDIKFISASHENKKDPGVLKKILLKKKDLIKGRVQMINWAKLPKNDSFQPHYHEDMEEIFIILNGKVKITINKEKEILNKGDAVIIPIKNVHQMKNISNQDVEYIIVGISQEKGGKTIVV